MQFSEKLDFLMNITNTSNSALGHKVKLDPSYISRLRKGKRNATKDETVITKMADYFARHCMSYYQHKALSDILNISMDAFDTNELSEYLAKWLISKKGDEIKAIDGFLDDLNKLNINSKMSKKMAETNKQINESIQSPQDEISIYYGIEGKRQAAEYFLLEVVAQDKPQTLLLYSDESTDWMTTDPVFAARWAQMMVAVLSKGNKIKIIHTVSRDLDEMLNAIHQWMPLYMTGLIEPYHYPKKRDGVFKHTMFISPGVSAVISSSVGQFINTTANLLIKNHDAIRAYTEEFHQYLSQCKPLMQIFAAKDKESYLDTLWEFEKEKSHTMIKTESLSIVTMPEEVSSGIMFRIGIENSDLAEYQRQRIKNFKKILQANTFCEIVPVFDLEMVKDNKIKVSFSDIMHGGFIYYMKEEYIVHLEHLVYLLNTYDNFHVKLIDGMPESNYMVYVKEELGAIVAKTSTPPVILAVNETNLTAAFWDYMRNIIGDKDYQIPNDQEQAIKLEEYIHKIKNS
ncbi:hypothetical protein [Sedimentibacter saalensis]|uniref:hypothetical protein n=1 Tax=Sedimentibacter saalensis TaxID=130788 RepID=UPI0028A08EDE|nr:hypothetical protein [Sedimentibacter saalensis]